MIIKGRAVGSVNHWARYLPEQGENETVKEHEIRGTQARDLKGALEEMRAASLATRSEGNFLYHASFNPRPDEKLTPEQWQNMCDFDCSTSSFPRRKGVNGAAELSKIKSKYVLNSR